MRIVAGYKRLVLDGKRDMDRRDVDWVQEID
jgi:hypothetical protein